MTRTAVVKEEPAPNPVESPPLASTQIHSKVGAGAIGGAVSVLGIYALERGGIVLPVEVGAALTTVVSFVFGYFAKS